MADQSRRPLGDAVAEAAQAAAERPAAPSRGRGGRPADFFGGELRRKDLLPLLLYHLIRQEPSYGNQLIESIERLTQGLISVNPNTMYPLLRDLEAKGRITGDWEHPDKRTRRFYSITPAGEEEYQRLLGEIEPFLDAMIRSVSLIKAEVFGSD